MMRLGGFLFATAILACLPAAQIAAQEQQAQGQGEEAIRGLVRAVNEAWITSDLNARIAAIPFREGEQFNAGQTLIKFVCEQLESQLAAARAEQQYSQATLDNSIALDRRKAIGRLEVAQNKAKFEKAQSEAAALGARVRDCTIAAPFNGRVAELKTHAFETPTPNQPLMRIIDTEKLELELIVPSVSLKWIKPGQTFKVKIDETGTAHTARVERVAAAVDSVSQTVKIMAVLTEFAPNILPGMSLSADLSRPAL